MIRVLQVVSVEMAVVALILSVLALETTCDRIEIAPSRYMPPGTRCWASVAALDRGERARVDCVTPVTE